jgi:hypothetical protein
MFAIVYYVPSIQAFYFKEINIWDRCYDFKNIFAKTFGENIGVFDSNQRQIMQKLVITLVLKKNAIFSPKIVKN